MEGREVKGGKDEGESAMERERERLGLKTVH